MSNRRPKNALQLLARLDPGTLARLRDGVRDQLLDQEDSDGYTPRQRLELIGEVNALIPLFSTNFVHGMVDGLREVSGRHRSPAPLKLAGRDDDERQETIDRLVELLPSFSTEYLRGVEFGLQKELLVNGGEHPGGSRNAR